MKNYKYIHGILVIWIAVLSCKKSSFLNAKSDQSLVVPTTLSDYQAILDADDIMNGTPGGQGLVPQMGESAADNNFVFDDWLSSYLTTQERNYYTWESNPYVGDPVLDWNIPYRSIFYANVVLDGMKEISIDKNDPAIYNNVVGSALFYRAHSFYQLAQVFAPPYAPNTAEISLGIPLRLEAQITEKITRASLAETYDRIINDLLSAKPLLPVKPLYKTRPSQLSVYALLARVYQTMQNYEKALLYADSSLMIQSALLDYTTLDQTAFFPIPSSNEEVIFHCTIIGGPNHASSPFVGVVDTAFYNLYDANDLRKRLFFSDYFGYFSIPTFMGSYFADGGLFAGLAVDEIYLIRAECKARQGNVDGAMEDLNTLLQKRWNSGTFVSLKATDKEDALTKILIERRKELCFRGLRWTDLKRLNSEGANIILKRVVNGREIQLEPNDNRYTFLIPPEVISYNPDMLQNQR